MDGTGGPSRSDETIVISGGRIAAVGPSAAVQAPAGVETWDVSGHTVIPGLVGLHEHLFYQMERKGSWSSQRPFAALYLASGVTTIRTAGTMDFGGDLRLKEAVDTGRAPGPRIHLTSPYFNAGSGAPDAEDVAGQVNRWADAGATSFKAYTSLRRDELRALIQAAHARGLQVTGHLCAVGFREAASLGIDNLEHGLLVDTEFYAGKRPDECPGLVANLQAIARVGVESAAVRRTIATLVAHGITVTSTLAVFESYTARHGAVDPRTIEVLAPSRRDDYLAERDRFTNPALANTAVWATALRNEMAFERAFVAAGGKLVAGVDPTGWGGIVAGFGDQREIELLGEAGFSPEEAVRIATANGASLLGVRDRFGTIAPGKEADLVVLRGDLSSNLGDIRAVERVFKGGVGYDPAALVASAQGTVGAFDLLRIARTGPGIIATLVLLVLVARVGWRIARRRQS
jgi:imidazolonepropionase-like amidohydrolase